MTRSRIQLIAVALVAACAGKAKDAGGATAGAPDTNKPSAEAKAAAQAVKLPANAALTNLDFEGGADAKGFPAGWGGGGLGYRFAVAAEGAHGGKGAFEMKWNRATAPDSNDWATLTQCVAADGWRGKRLQLTGWVKSAAVDSGAGLWMRVDTTTARGLPAAFDNMLDRPVKGTSDWKEYAVVLDVDAKATNICFGVVMVATGTVWADDLGLKVVGKEVKSTAQKPD